MRSQRARAPVAVISAATREAAGPSRSAQTTAAPSRAKARAMAAPLPWPAPVTMAARPISRSEEDTAVQVEDLPGQVPGAGQEDDQARELLGGREASQHGLVLVGVEKPAGGRGGHALVGDEARIDRVDAYVVPAQVLGGAFHEPDHPRFGGGVGG